MTFVATRGPTSVFTVCTLQNTVFNWPSSNSHQTFIWPWSGLWTLATHWLHLWPLVENWHFWKFKVQRSRSSHYQIWTKIQYWIQNFFQMYQVGTALLGIKYCQSKIVWDLCSAFLKFETKLSKVMVTTWPNMAQNTVLGFLTESDTHYKGGFSKPMCDLGILSQPAGGNFIRSTLSALNFI